MPSRRTERPSPASAPDLGDLLPVEAVEGEVGRRAVEQRLQECREAREPLPQPRIGRGVRMHGAVGE
ncbi:hypothetical protein N177_2370 [Lutibaculum baratangense AMV1]|uniref:Uncharacterized protein n=1 Tax=Lutibaculum baratangense AMV1 TaxID=631454 RepID=V4REH4_9HYPH|nr:hypothetical protein N177_2370 [Lutibaculum baratangense AMV1]